MLPLPGRSRDGWRIEADKRDPADKVAASAPRIATHGAPSVGAVCSLVMGRRETSFESGHVVGRDVNIDIGNTQAGLALEEGSAVGECLRVEALALVEDFLFARSGIFWAITALE